MASPSLRYAYSFGVEIDDVIAKVEVRQELLLFGDEVALT